MEVVTMPSETSPSSSSSRRRFPSIKADHGEDPGRWLDCDLMDRPTRVVTETDDRGHTVAKVVADSDVDPAGRMVRERIASIESESLLNAWEAVERNLARQDDREPREIVLRWLDQRRAALPVDHGETFEYPSTESSATWSERDDGEQARVAGVGGRA